MDLEEIARKANDNPVFYVQYAHARISSVLRNAEDIGAKWRESAFIPELLDMKQENELLGVIEKFPAVIATAAELREPHRVARFLEELASAYHRFYDACRVLPRSDEELGSVHIARLWVCAATQQTLANGLELLGVTAREKM